MGQESASYFLPIAPGEEEAVVVALREGGAESCGSEGARVDLLLLSQYRYWIDLRVHGGSAPLLEIRIALTNDEWSIRAPLEVALAELPADVARGVLCNEEGEELGAPAESGWSLRVEDDYGRRRATFVERIGDFTAPISADHVYMYIHQTRWKRDNDAELAWHREREIASLEQMWDPPTAGPELPPGHPDAEPPEA